MRGSGDHTQGNQPKPVIAFGKLLPGLIWLHAALQGLLSSCTKHLQPSVSTQRQQPARVADFAYKSGKIRIRHHTGSDLKRKLSTERLLAATRAASSHRIHQDKVFCNATLVAGGKSPLLTQNDFRQDTDGSNNDQVLHWNQQKDLLLLCLSLVITEFPPVPTWRRIRSNRTVYFGILKQNLSTLCLRKTFCLWERKEAALGLETQSWFPWW